MIKKHRNLTWFNLISLLPYAIAYQIILRLMGKRIMRNNVYLNLLQDFCWKSSIFVYIKALTVIKFSSIRVADGSYPFARRYFFSRNTMLSVLA